MSYGTECLFRSVCFGLGVLELGHTIPWSDLYATVGLVLMEKSGAFCYIVMAGPDYVRMNFS